MHKGLQASLLLSKAFFDTTECKYHQHILPPIPPHPSSLWTFLASSASLPNFPIGFFSLYVHTNLLFIYPFVFLCIFDRISYRILYARPCIHLWFVGVWVWVLSIVSSLSCFCRLNIFLLLKSVGTCAHGCLHCCVC